MAEAKRKRLRMADSNNSRLEAYIHSNLVERHRFPIPMARQGPVKAESGAAAGRLIRQGDRLRIKKEPIGSPECLDVSMVPNYGSVESQAHNNFARSPGYSMNVPGPSAQFQDQYSFASPLNNFSMASNAALSREKARDSSIMNLDSLNIEQHPGIDLMEVPSINLPLCQSNVEVLDSHFLENLSSLYVGGPHNGSATMKQLNIDPKNADNRKDESVRPKFNPSQAGSALSNFFSGTELPVLTFSGMLSSADLEGGEQLNSATIRELENALGTKPANQ